MTTLSIERPPDVTQSMTASWLNPHAKATAKRFVRCSSGTTGARMHWHLACSAIKTTR